MKKSLPLIIIFLLVIFISACPNGTTDNTNDDTNKPAGEESETTGTATEDPEEPAWIYFGGRDDVDSSHQQAAYWKVNRNDLSDITETTLTVGTNLCTVVEMKISGDDVYSLVKDGTSHNMRCYKNSDLLATLDDGHDTLGESFQFKNEKLYVPTNEYITSGEYHIMLWIVESDGTTAKYSVDTGYYANVNDIIIDSDAIYMTGYYSDTREPAVYHASVYIGSVSNPAAGFTEYKITDDDHESQSFRLYKDDNTLYICGRLEVNPSNYKLLATYWTMNLSNLTFSAPVTLGSDSSNLCAIQVIDGSVYTGGIEDAELSSKQPKYWHGSTPHNLCTADNFYWVGDSYFDGEKMYVCGSNTISTYLRDCLWVDNQELSLADLDHESSLNCIAVE